MSTLAAATAAAIGPSTGLRIGTVTTVTTGRFVINVAGAAISTAGRLASYTPTAGDTVAVIRHESTWLILGRVIGGA